MQCSTEGGLDEPGEPQEMKCRKKNDKLGRSVSAVCAASHNLPCRDACYLSSAERASQAQGSQHATPHWFLIQGFPPLFMQAGDLQAERSPARWNY